MILGRELCVLLWVGRFSPNNYSLFQLLSSVFRLVMRKTSLSVFKQCTWMELWYWLCCASLKSRLQLQLPHYIVWEIYFSFPKQNRNQLNPSRWTLKLLWKWFAWQNSPTNNSHSVILDALCNVHNFVTIFHSRAVDPEDWLTGKAPSMHPLKKEKKVLEQRKLREKEVIAWSGMGGLLGWFFFNLCT